MSSTQVLIVGAGPTGLVLALRLAHHGIAFRIIEKNSGPGQASRAMVVHARTLEFYQQLGFADELVAKGIKMETVHFRERGEEVAKVSLGNIGTNLSPFPFILCFPQDDHERFLVEKLEALGATIEWNVELKEFSQDENGARTILLKDGTEEVCDANYLCGCDGAHSSVRHGLELDFPGGTYDQVFYVADVQIENEGPNEMFGNLQPNGFALMLPVRSSGMKRLIGTLPEAIQGRDDVTFEDIRSFTEDLMDIHVTQVNWFSTYHVHHRVAAKFRVGRVFIAGDAGHIHSPVGGQGMNTGIGDAVNLSWKLANVLKGQADASLLDTYETERLAFAHTLISTTDRAFVGVTNKAPIGQFLRTWVLPHLLSVVTGFSAVKRVIFNTVSQVRINYHQSALSEGHVGEIQGGDRLPWVPLNGCSNYVSLTALNWQVHVYGTIESTFRDALNDLGLSFHEFDWDEHAEDAGFKRDAFYLIRPDGYVALASTEQHILPLNEFIAKLGVKFSA